MRDTYSGSGLGVECKRCYHCGIYIYNIGYTAVCTGLYGNVEDPGYISVPTEGTNT